MTRKIKAKLVLSLRSNGLSRNAIASTQHMSKTSVCEVFDRADELGVSFDDVKDKEDDEVYTILFPERHSTQSVYREPDWERIHSEMARVGVTLKLLHAEYEDACRKDGVVSMGYSRFCKGYEAFTVVKSVTSRVGHKAGRIMEVDWSGPTMAVADPTTGEVARVYLFVATLPFSRYSYVEPTLDMKQETWLRCHVHAFEFFGGSTTCIVPDNLKAGVTAHPREGEVVLNDAYQQLAAHYSAAVLPARPRRPKDKPSVENTVGNIATAVIASLRNDSFASLDELKRAVTERLRAYNDAPFQKREGSRSDVFLAEESALLHPLPAVPYEICTWVHGRKVQMNSHVAYKKNYYSVSYTLVGSIVDLRVTDTCVEVYSGQTRVATHRLLPGYATNRYSTNEAHLPDDRRYSDWDSPRIRRWAERIGPGCAACIERIFDGVRFDEQGFDAALAILRLSHTYTAQRLERACSMALDSRVRSPRYKHIEPILRSGQDRQDAGDDADDGAGYVRGSDFYRR